MTVTYHQAESLQRGTIYTTSLRRYTLKEISPETRFWGILSRECSLWLIYKYVLLRRTMLFILADNLHFSQYEYLKCNRFKAAASLPRKPLKILFIKNIRKQIASALLEQFEICFITTKITVLIVKYCFNQQHSKLDKAYMHH